MRTMHSFIFVISIVSMTTYGYLTRANVGGTHNVFARQEEDPIDYTAQDYVMDGLVSMWDGIENAGWGLHEDSPQYWSDLVGEDYMAKTGSANTYYPTYFTENGLCGIAYNHWPSKSQRLYSALIGTERTVEVVFTRTYMGNTVGLPNFTGNNWLSMQGFSGASMLCYHEGAGFWVTPPIQTAPVTFSLTWVVEDGKCHVYVNGMLQSTVNSGGMSVPNNSIMTLGQNIGLVNGTSYFAALTHSVRIYSKALSDAEVKANLTVDRGRFGL
ncbi:MAG: hypothetical protein J6Q22_10475 [Prevotella sp.]|nr:hypothetical protein [Prevotella sp.]